MASDRTTDTGSSFAEKVLGIGRPDGKTKIQGRQCRVSSYFKETLNLYSLVKDRPCSGPRGMRVSELVFGSALTRIRWDSHF